MGLQISAEEVLEIVKQKITDKSDVIIASDISEMKFDYDNIREEVIGISVELKGNAY